MRTNPELLRKELQLQKTKLQSQLNFQHHLQHELQEQLLLQNHRIHLMNNSVTDNKTTESPNSPNRDTSLMETNPVCIFIIVTLFHQLIDVMINYS